MTTLCLMYGVLVRTYVYVYVCGIQYCIVRYGDDRTHVGSTVQYWYSTVVLDGYTDTRSSFRHVHIVMHISTI